MDRECVKSIILCIAIIICILEAIVILWLRNRKSKQIDIEETIGFFRKIWGTFVIYVIATSIIGLFIASFVLKTEITLAKMNEWVSLVLGLIALFIGIISLFLSFYNVDQAYKSQEDNLREMEKVQQAIEQKIYSLDSNMRMEFKHIYMQDIQSKNKNSVRIQEKRSGLDDYGDI